MWYVGERQFTIMTESLRSVSFAFFHRLIVVLNQVSTPRTSKNLLFSYIGQRSISYTTVATAFTLGIVCTLGL